MLFEIMQLSDALLNSRNSELYVNDDNANDNGINMSELRNHFEAKAGRKILTNENIKVRFHEEGKVFDFSTFDNVHLRVNFDLQKVAPNKGGGEDSGL